MNRCFDAAASGMWAQQQHIDLIANNLANVNTTGYKRSRAEFQDLLYDQLLRPGDYASPTGVQVGYGTRLAGIQRSFAPGALSVTGRHLDLAIQGDGLFRLRRPDGTEVYTRDGAFRRDAAGRLVSQDGYLLVGERGPITVPTGVDRVDIASDGAISYADPATGAPVELDRLSLATFTNPAGLTALGQNVLAAGPASGNPTFGRPGEGTLGALAQGALEASNVEVVNEMMSLIMAQRAYEMNSRALQAADEMAALANNLRRG